MNTLLKIIKAIYNEFILRYVLFNGRGIILRRIFNVNANLILILKENEIGSKA